MKEENKTEIDLTMQIKNKLLLAYVLLSVIILLYIRTIIFGFKDISRVEIFNFLSVSALTLLILAFSYFIVKNRVKLQTSVLPVIVIGVFLAFIVFKISRIFTKFEVDINWTTWQQLAIFLLPGALLYFIIKFLFFIISKYNGGRPSIIHRFVFYVFFHIHKYFLNYTRYWRLLFYMVSIYRKRYSSGKIAILLHIHMPLFVIIMFWELLVLKHWSLTIKFMPIVFLGNLILAIIALWDLFIKALENDNCYLRT